MNMPKSVAEVEEIEINAGVVINGVDSPHLMSVDSTEPIETDVEELEEENPAEVEKKEEEKKEEPEPESKNKEEEEESEEEEPEPEVSPDDSKKVKKRIGKLTKKWRTAERERDFEKQKRLDLEKKLNELEAKMPATDKPQKEDFEDEDDYIEALVDWKTESKLKASQAKVEKAIKDEDEQKAVTETYDGLDDAIEQGSEKYKDFNDVVFNEDLILSENLTQIALDSDIAEDILYYLGSNPEESERLSKLDPIRAAKEIGKIEIKLEASEEEEEEEEESSPTPKKKKQTKAPAPIKPVRTDGVTEKDPNKMSPKEYRAWREKQSK